MARLVKESGILGKAGEELTAKNLTEKVSFDQMIKAIHKVQQNMGITGTTAKEAAGTIEGSTGSMQAAWENLLTGMADDTQDIDQLWDDFIKSAVASAKNMFPRIKKLVNNFSKFLDKKLREYFPEFMKDFDKVKKAITSLFKFIQDNSDEVLSILQGIAVAFVTYRAVATITQVISAFKAFVAAVKAGETALVALNTTMSISPVGLFAAAIAGLVTIMLALNAAEERAKNAQYGLNAEQEQYIENAKQLREEYQEMDSARDENNGKIRAEYDYLKDLKDEYNTLIATNGKVKKGYEARADFILNELARAMGVEREEIDKVIEKNGLLGESLDQLMIKQQAQALLESNQADYNKAIEERAGALAEYQNNLKSVQKEQDAYNSRLRQANMSEKDFFEYRTAKKNGDWEKQLEYRKKYTLETLDGLERTFEAYNKAQDGLFSAEDAYVGFSQTIQNYEGLSVAVLEGDSKKIKDAINKLQNDVLTAETGNARTLELQAKKFKQNYEDMQQAVADGIAGISKEDLKASKDLLKKANKELIKYFKSTDVAKEAKNRGYEIPKFITNGIKDGTMSVDSAMQRLQTLIDFDSGEYGVGAAATAKQLGLEIPQTLANAILSGTIDLERADKAMIEVITTALEDAAADAGIKAEDIPASISAAVLEGDMTIKEAVKKIKSTAADGLTDSDGTFKKKGNDAASDFATGITDKKEDAKQAGQTIFDAAAGALSGNTTDSGKNFAYGFANGINDVLGTGRIGETAGLVSKSAIDALKKAQQEGSPSKLTFKSGVNFTQGFINGIVSLQSQLVKTTQNLVKAAAKQLVKLDNYNFDEVQQNTSSYLSKTMASRIEYMQNKISYQNEKKLDEFNEKIVELENQRDKKLEKLQSKSEKAKDATEKKAIKNQIASTKERYKKLIKIQEEYRDAYQTASGKMINEFNKAISDYQSEAQSLIDSTVKGITDTYKARYDGLLSKQNELISKLKSAGQLFEISGAGVITVSDIKEQTKQIQDYASKLKIIKSKVSNDLFNQIASYDIKEGEAFINQLLSLSDAELKAYDAAYSEKISLADSLSKDIYKQDFKRVSKDYKKAIKEAMAGIPAQLEELGENSMKGFLKGLTKNTKYMDKTVKSFVNEMVGEFKKELKINSPSRVMEGLGEYSGEGYGDGLRNMIKYVKSVASEIVGATTTSFDGVKSNLGNVKGVIGTNANGLNAASQTVVNNYSLVQNNTSPKSLTALETYNARRQQIAMIKAATQNA